MRIRSLYSESELIQGIQAGGVARERCMDSLLHKHRKLIQRGIRSYRLSREEAQEAYLDAMVALCRQIEKGNFRGDCKLSTYLYRIYDNKCKNKIRDRKGDPTSWIDEMPDLPERAHDALAELIQQEEFEAVKELLRELGGKCKDILILAEYHGYSQAEIAQQLGLKTARVVAVSRHRCLNKLKRFLSGKPVSHECELQPKTTD
ncbi:MAG: sigma-70 family RNA polymerase sigma factor [Bacteroidota bacterium]